MLQSQLLTELDIDLDKPLICEVEWRHDDGELESCGRSAEWIGDGHDQTGDHNYVQILLCPSCKNMVAAHHCTDCVGKPPLLINFRQL